MVETLPGAKEIDDAIWDADAVVEERKVRTADRPIPFEKWLEIGRPDEFSELIDGVLVERPMIQREHEMAERWLDRVLGGYVEELELGVVACSRSPVRINDFRGRLPDLFFVRKDRSHLVQQKATYGAPDFVAEIVSPDDRPSHLYALESDYRGLGVTEIWFVDLPRQRIRILRKDGDDYTETIVATGPVRLSVMEGFEIMAEWLLHEPRPKSGRVYRALLGDAG
jgi:Uma2 family endonuclease